MHCYDDMYYPTGLSISDDLTKIYSANLTRHHFDTHTHAHTQLLKSIGVQDRAVLKAGKYKAEA